MGWEVKFVRNSLAFWLVGGVHHTSAWLVLKPKQGTIPVSRSLLKVTCFLGYIPSEALTFLSETIYLHP